VLDLKVTGTLRPSFVSSGKAVDYFGAGSVSVLRDGALTATDAMGRDAGARFEAIADGVRIVIDDAGAVYPITVQSVATNAAWTVSGDENGARLGQSVAPAGDVNGDGYSDVIVGANFHDAGGGAGADRGQAYVYLGGAGGLATSPAWTVSGDENADQFGWVVAAAGDVNGDGYGDVIVGAHMHDAGGGANANRGRVYVYLGGASGLATTPAWTGSGDENNGAYGFSVATAGDVNADGYADVIVGASQHDFGAGADRGQAYLYLGGAGGLATSPVSTLSGDENNALFGASVATAGDVNGDGFADVIIGAYTHDAGAGANANRGRAYVYLGGVSGLAANPLWTGSGDENGAFYGWCVASAGDINGDGYADIVVGAYQHDAGGAAGANRGRAYMYVSGPGGPASIPGWTRSGDEDLAFFGHSLATAGDVNGDGYADVIVGADGHNADAGAGADRGRAYLFLGSGGTLSQNPIWTVSGDENSDVFAHSVATAGDINGDGFSDVVVGAYGHDAGAGSGANLGRAYAYLGAGGPPPASPAAIRSGDEDIAQYGRSLASAGDVNGDGYSDWIIGAYGHDAGGAVNTNAGRAYVYLGAPGGLSATPAWTGSGDENYAGYGGAVSSAGDVNGDGYADVLVAAIYHDAGEGFSADRGRVYLYLGSAAGLSTSPAWVASGDENRAYFGIAVATAGDVNGDGYSDVIIGAFGHDAGAGVDAERGRAYLYLGSPVGLSPDPAWTASGSQNQARFGNSVGTAGDTNGDGYSDVIVGAYTDPTDGFGRGRAFVYLGSAAGLSASPVWTAAGDEDQCSFGDTVATAGDVNADGYADIVIGASHHDAGGGLGADRGRAYVYLGGASGPAIFPVATRSGDVNSASFGFSVASAGDVNGDGYSDVVIGAWSHAAGNGTGASRGRAYVYPGSANGIATFSIWFGTGDENLAYYGWCVASAGDIDGDGFADILVGAQGHDAGAGTDANRGRAYLYQGNCEGQIAGGVTRLPRQQRSDAFNPISLLGSSDSESEFRVTALGRTAAGRDKVRLQWQVRPLGTPFGTTGIDSSAPQDTGTPGASGSASSFDEFVGGLAEGTFYHWRLRTVSANPFFPTSPWMSVAGNNVTETKLRTLGCVDHDGDGFGDVSDASCLSLVPDCNDHDASIWGTPGEIVNVRFVTKVVQAWDPPLEPGALTSALVYDTLRATAPSDFLSAACAETSDGPNTTASDPLPSPGQRFFYLTRAKNACPQGTGSFGTDSHGVPRATRSCP
jgi:Na+-transporting NADH:ubiquinone oxidoreductase subunit NqrB